MWMCNGKSLLFTLFFVSNILILVHSGFYKVPECDSNNECPCKPGYWGRNCKFCRLRLTDDSGIITDGEANYVESSKCSWLIETSRPNSTIELEFDQFATECAWDHLFIFAGSSIQAPLLGTLSGLLRDPNNKAIDKEPIRHLSIKSNKAFLYFFSDANYILTGFNIKYRIGSDCSFKCNYHGHCDSHGNCICNKGWAGSTCNITTCATSCVSGSCNTVTRQCQGCKTGYTGPSCNITLGSGFWTHVPANHQNKVVGRASHASSVIGNWLWIHGGYSLNPTPFHDFIRYHVHSNTWEVVKPHVSSTVPERRYGHSMIAYNESLLVYGGTIKGKAVNELWLYNTLTSQWSLISPAAGSADPIAVSGHTANLVKTKMIVIFGYGPKEGYTQKVQQFDLVSKKWRIFNISALIVHATFGHSSSYQPETGRIYIHGGYKYVRDRELSSSLSIYEPETNKWSTLLASGYGGFLHTSVLVGNLLIVFGGNTHNDTNESSKKAKCFSYDTLLYDTHCNIWTKLSTKSLTSLNARYGHTALQANGTMYIFGGFQGTMLNDILTYSVGDCSVWKNRTTCLKAYPTHGCVWLIKTGGCIGPLDASSYSTRDIEKPVCPANPKKCSTYSTCNQCLSSLFSCQWCNKKCKDSGDSCTKAITNEEKCPAVSTNCPATGCVHTPCHNYSSCSGCINNKNCIWCESQQQCVGLNAYVVSFPYGQCHEWTKEKCEDVRCKSMKKCNQCHTLPGCGWCDDGSGTGLGECMAGGDDGPFTSSSNSSLVPSNQCLPKSNEKRWFFVECPVCQCNGHSTCDEKGNCIKCQHNSNGTDCQTCATGYYGDPKYGGICQPCQCNQHGNTCNPESGVCNCRTKGVTGNKCELCNHRKSYYGNSTNGGHCYYNLTSGFMFTFNVTGYTGISFLNIPKKTDRNVIFSVTAIGPNEAMMNMSYKTKYGSESFILKGKSIGKVEKTFKHDDFDFGSSSLFTFYVDIYNVKGSCTIEISFSQGSPFALLKFFLTFFGCFFSILVVTFIAWKIRVRYNRYVMRRQRIVEMHQMAKRPTASLRLSLEKQNGVYVTKTNSNPVTIQPFTNSRAAVATFVFCLPTLSNGLTPIGQSGVCFGSVLIDHRNHPTHTSRCYTFQKADKRQRRTSHCI